MLLEKYRELAIRAHNGTSFTPEKRGESYIKGYSDELAEHIEKVKALGGDANAYREKYERLFVNWMSAKSRCISSMIAGPSGFPVRRAQKANQSEHNRMNEFIQFKERYFARLERNNRREARAAADPVAEMREKLESAEKLQERMKAANKVVQSKKTTDAEKVALLVEQGFSENRAAELLVPDWCKRVGFPAYALTNNLANIKRMRERLKELEAKAAATTTITDRPDGIQVVENTTADRLQIFFPGKPAPETIATLKKNAFKWSPSNMCWQRQLTDNARQAAAKILK